MKQSLLTICAYIFDFISLIFSVPGAALIFIGFIFSDISESLKHM